MNIKKFFPFFLIICVFLTAGEYEINVHGLNKEARLLRIELSGENIAMLGGHTQCIRIYDRSGNIVSYSLKTMTESRLAESRTKAKLKLTQVKQLPNGQLEILCNTEEKQNIPSEEAILAFSTGLRDFEQQVRIFGISKDGTEKVLLNDGFIFDSTSNITLQNLEVHFNMSGYRSFRIVLEAASLERKSALRFVNRQLKEGKEAEKNESEAVSRQAFKIDSVTLWCVQTVKTDAKPMSIEHAADFSKSPDSGTKGVSEAVAIPKAYPVKGLVFNCVQENYSRKIRIYHIEKSGGERLLAEGRIQRLNLGKLQEENSITFTPISSGKLKIQFIDSDNPPIELSAVNTIIPAYSLSLIATGDMMPLKLTAIPGEKAPDYDTASLLAFGAENASPIVVRPTHFNGEPVKCKVESTGKFSRPIMIAAILIAAAVMAFSIYSTAGKIKR